MNETVTKTHEQAVNDDVGILIADFTAQTSYSTSDSTSALRQ